MTQYPGSDPDDPFARPPTEGQRPADGSTPPPSTEETAPIQGATPPTGQPPADRPLPENPWAGYDQPADPSQPGQAAPPPPPPPSPAQAGDQTPAYGQPGYGQPGYGQPGYGQPGYGLQHYGQPQMYMEPPKHPQATTALVLGLIGLIGGCLCGLPLVVSPFAWVIGARARREIAASQGQLGGDGNAQAGFILGIIGTVLLALGVIAIVLLVVVGLATGGTTSSSPTMF